MMPVKGMHCTTCAQTVTKSIFSKPGVPKANLLQGGKTKPSYLE